MSEAQTNPEGEVKQPQLNMFDVMFGSENDTNPEQAEKKTEAPISEENLVTQLQQESEEAEESEAEEEVLEATEDQGEEIEEEVEEETTEMEEIVVEVEPETSLEEVVKEIADAVAEQMKSMEDKMAKMEEKMNSFMEAPAAEPTVASTGKKIKAGFSKFDIKGAKNSKDMELALKLIKK